VKGTSDKSFGLHEPQGEGIMVAEVVGGFDGRDDGEDYGTNADQKQQRNSDDEREGQATEAIDVDRDVKVQSFSRIARDVIRLLSHGKINHQR
jgi:hypothetical protein